MYQLGNKKRGVEMDTSGEQNEIKKKRYGILGGTFDPIHNGHLFIAQTAMEELQLDKIMFIPNRVSPHKTTEKVTEAYQRLIMAEIAVIDHDKFCVSSMEINRKGPSYTIDTIQELVKENPNTDFYFITGTDVFMELDTWKNHELLLKLIKFVVVTRSGFSYIDLDQKIKYLKEKYDGDIVKIKIPSLEISSTDIRNRVEMGRFIKYLVPDGVKNYIIKHKLYSD